MFTRVEDTAFTLESIDEPMDAHALQPGSETPRAPLKFSYATG